MLLRTSKFFSKVMLTVSAPKLWYNETWAWTFMQNWGWCSGTAGVGTQHNGTSTINHPSQRNWCTEHVYMKMEPQNCNNHSRVVKPTCTMPLRVVMMSLACPTSSASCTICSSWFCATESLAASWLFCISSTFCVWIGSVGDNEGEEARPAQPEKSKATKIIIHNWYAHFASYLQIE